MDPIPFVLLELGLLLGGLAAAAIGYRLYRLPATPANEAYLARVGPQLRLLGPLMFLGAAIFPATVYEGDEWYRRACGIGMEVLLAGAVVFAIRTWRREPAVAWPRTVIAWLQYLFSALMWGGIVAGAFIHWGMQPAAASLAVFYPIGLVVARVVVVWHTRVLYHQRVAPATSPPPAARVRRS